MNTDQRTRKSSNPLPVVAVDPDDIILPGVSMQSLPEHLRKRFKGRLSHGYPHPVLVLAGSGFELPSEKLNILEAERALRHDQQVTRVEAASAMRTAKADIWHEPMLLLAKANRSPHGDMTTAALARKILKQATMKGLVTDSVGELATGKKLTCLPSEKTLKHRIKWLEDNGQLNLHSKVKAKRHKLAY